MIWGSFLATNALASAFSSVRVSQLNFMENRSELFDSSEYTLELYRSKEHGCINIKYIDFEKSPLVQIDREIKVFVDHEAYTECAENSETSPERIYIGSLPSGEYLVKIFENDELTISKKIYFPSNQSVDIITSFSEPIMLIDNQSRPGNIW